jgi:type II secretory pathway predicted ATPase ExeA
MPELAQLMQRVRLRFHLTPLSREDADHYIQHRLEVAGSNGREIFASDTYSLIHRFTGGVPRLINTLCDTAMMAAFAESQDTVSLDILKSAIAELLSMPPPSCRSSNDGPIIRALAHSILWG